MWKLLSAISILALGLAGQKPTTQPKSSPGYLAPESRARLGVSTPRSTTQQSTQKGGQQPGQGSPVPLDKVQFRGGWPVVPGMASGSAPRGRSDFENGAPSGARADRPDSTPAATRPRETRTSPLESPLSEVFRAIGDPLRLRALRGVSAVIRMEMYDDRGALIGQPRRVAHSADVTRSRRDRVLQGKYVFGRDGKHAFAEVDQFAAPRLDPRAARQLEIHGLLMRAPWVLADGKEYHLFPPETIRDGGEARMRIRAERADPNATYGPLDRKRPMDRFELICRRDPAIPEELRYTLAETGVERRVRLLDWRVVEGMGIRMPWRREIRDAEDQLIMVLQVESLAVGQEFVAAEFRPR